MFLHVVVVGLFLMMITTVMFLNASFVTTKPAASLRRIVMLIDVSPSHFIYKSMKTMCMNSIGGSL